jgi:uncharacterized protein YegL
MRPVPAERRHWVSFSPWPRVLIVGALVSALVGVNCAGAPDRTIRKPGTTATATAATATAATATATTTTVSWDALCDSVAARSKRCEDDLLLPDDPVACKRSRQCLERLLQPLVFQAMATCAPGSCETECTPRRLADSIALDAAARGFFDACARREVECPELRCAALARSGVSMMRGDTLSPMANCLLAPRCDVVAGCLIERRDRLTTSLEACSAQVAATPPIEPCVPPSPSANPSAVTLALALVLDRSGSMHGQPLEMAKKAAIAAVDRLRAGDSLAVIAFDSQPIYVVPMGPVSKANATQKIRLIQPGGGTEIFSALDAAYQKLAITRARRKHVVLLTDGQAPNNGIRDLTLAMRAEGITVTTIGLGPSADNELLRTIAAVACGRSVPVDDPKKLPAIFAREVNAARQ